MIKSFIKAVGYFLGIPAKREVKNSPLFGKNKQKYPLYEHYKGGLYRLLMVAISEESGCEMAVYRSEATGIIYVLPMREFREKFKEFDVGM